MRLKKGSKAAKDYMAKIRAAKKTTPAKKRAIKKVVVAKNKAVKVVRKKQTGTTNKKVDSKRQAKPVGKRLSKTKKVYYESRANRSDKGVLLGISSIKTQTSNFHKQSIMQIARIVSDIAYQKEILKSIPVKSRPAIRKKIIAQKKALTEARKLKVKLSKFK